MGVASGITQAPAVTVELGDHSLFCHDGEVYGDDQVADDGLQTCYDRACVEKHYRLARCLGTPDLGVYAPLRAYFLSYGISDAYSRCCMRL